MSLRLFFSFFALFFSFSTVRALDLTVTGPRGVIYTQVNHITLGTTQNLAQVTQTYLHESGMIRSLTFTPDQKQLNAINEWGPHNVPAAWGHYAYGWCCRIDGAPLKQSLTDQMITPSTEKIDWYYGYIRIGSHPDAECISDEIQY